VAPSNTHKAVPYTFTSTLLPADTVALAMPIIPVASEVVALTARDTDKTVVNFCNKLAVLPFDV
jgi:hypothetical protein